MVWGAQACPLVHGAPHSAHTCRMGRCATVRGPSNSQEGRNGIRNMAARAARPAHGISRIVVLPDDTTPGFGEALHARPARMRSVGPARTVPGSPSRALFVHLGRLARSATAKRPS